MKHQAIIGDRAYIVHQTFSDSDNDFQVVWQPVNPRTGKPWQATRQIARIQGERAKGKAMRIWLMECNKARSLGRE